MPKLLVHSAAGSSNAILAELKRSLPGAIVDDYSLMPACVFRATLLLHETRRRSSVRLLPVADLASCPMVIAALQVGAPESRDPVTLVRHLVDRVWRESALLQLLCTPNLSAMTAHVLQSTLTEWGPLASAAHYRASEQVGAEHSACRRLTRRSGYHGPSLKVTELFDWVRYLRFIAGTGLGVTQEERAAEIGSNLRSMRRVRARLARWLPTLPRRTEPADVIWALLIRLAPPLGVKPADVLASRTRAGPAPKAPPSQTPSPENDEQSKLPRSLRAASPRTISHHTTKAADRESAQPAAQRQRAPSRRAP